MSDQRVTTCGKQLLLDGRNLAQCESAEAAEVLAMIVNNAPLFVGVSQSDRDRIERFFE